MRKVYLLGFVLLAMTASSALAATSAFAGEFLFNGATITSFPLTIDVVSEGLLEDMGVEAKDGIKNPDLLCSALMEIKIETPTLVLVTAVLNLANTSTTIECEEMGTTCGKASVVAENLPWDLELELMANGEILLVSKPEGGTNPGYETDCEVFFILETDLCEGPLVGTQVNDGEGILGTFSEGIGTPNGNCTLGGAGEGLIEGTTLATDTAGGTLSVS